MFSMQTVRMTGSQAVRVLLLLISVCLWGVLCHSPGRNQQKRSEDLAASLESVVSAQAQKVSTLEAEVQALKNSNARLEASQGSSFVRWGRSTCPSGTTLLYSGYVAGNLYTHSGGGSNYLCVTKEPVYDSTPLDTYFGVLTGIEYYVPGHHYTDALCAVCLSPRAATYMLPGTNRCPAGSVALYRGHLSAENHYVDATSEYVCLDESPEDRHGSQANQASGYIEHVRSHCGALPCPPYQEAKVVTCVVCSV